MTLSIGRTDAEAETPILWPPHAKCWLIGKDSDAVGDWGQEEKWMTEDEMAGWHHWLDGRESEWTPGVGDGQGGLACCDSWGCKELDKTEQLNWTELNCASQALMYIQSIFSDYYKINLEFSKRENWKIHKIVETKKHTCKQPMDQRRNHKGN